MATKVGGLDNSQLPIWRFGAFFIALAYVHHELPYFFIVHFMLHSDICDLFFCLGS